MAILKMTKGQCTARDMLASLLRSGEGLEVSEKVSTGERECWDDHGNWYDGDDLTAALLMLNQDDIPLHVTTSDVGLKWDVRFYTIHVDQGLLEMLEWVDAK